MDNNIYLSETDNIKIEQFNMITASTGFYHEDRIAGMYVMIYVFSGCIYVSEDGTDYELKAGDMLLLKKGSHQYGLKKTPAGTSWIYAHFQISQEEETDTGKMQDAINSEQKKYPLVKYANFNERHDYVTKLKNMYDLACSERPFCMKRVEMYLQMLFFDIYEDSIKKQENGIVSRINEIVMDNIAGNISAEFFEKKMHLTYKYVNKLYKNATGKCIKQFHGELRIKAAAEKLKISDGSIEEIAAEMGYEDPLYFSKCFKKQMGISPREYRKAILTL